MNFELHLDKLLHHCDKTLKEILFVIFSDILTSFS